jgi:post-segregation antitoxin (ccd killing protein)
MDITVYLPDEIGERAKSAGLNLSRLLRDAVSQELERRDALAETLENPETYNVALEDRDGLEYTGRITGRLIASSGDIDVYLAEDERVLVHDRFKLKYWEEDDPQENLRDVLEPGSYRTAMNALGLEAIIDL